MTQRASLIWLMALLAVACADEQTAYARMLAQPALKEAARSTSSLSGRIIVRGLGSGRIVELRDDHDDVHRLLGSEAVTLANVEGGDVAVWGTWDANPGFVVQKFAVTGMHGRPALDGTLVTRGAHFAVRLVDGSVQAVIGMKADCAAFVGKRIWVVGWEGDAPMQFGLIEKPRPK